MANIKAMATGKFELPIAGLPTNGEAGSVSSQAIIAPSPVQSMLCGWTVMTEVQQLRDRQPSLKRSRMRCSPS